MRDRRRHEARVSCGLVPAVGELDVGLLEVAQLRGRYGGRGACWDPRLEAFKVRQLKINRDNCELRLKLHLGLAGDCQSNRKNKVKGYSVPSDKD